MKISKKILCCLLSLFVSGAIIYGDMLYSFPADITMYQNEEHSSSLGIGVSIGNIPEDVCAGVNSGKVTPCRCLLLGFLF